MNGSAHQPDDGSHFNPCKLGRKQWLAPLGDALADFFINKFEEPTDGCPCCIAVRILLLSGAAGIAGFTLGALL